MRIHSLQEMAKSIVFHDPGVHFVDEIKFMILLYKTSGCVADVQRCSARLPLRTRAVVRALAH